MDFPTSSQLTAELKRVRYRKEFGKMLRSTISSLLVVAAIAVLISMLFLPVLRVTGTSMTPTLVNDELVICSKRSNFQSGDVVAFYFNNKKVSRPAKGRETRGTTLIGLIKAPAQGP